MEQPCPPYNNATAMRAACALQQKQRLTRRMLAAWPRRGHTLLHMRCGGGALLECLWECGFEVSGYEPDVQLRAQAERTRPPCVDVGGGIADHLPYEDNSFDYSVFSLSCGNDTAALTETWRVTRKGILLLGWNICSLSLLATLFPCLDDRALPPRPAAHWWRSWRLVKRLQPDSRSTLRSTLLLPPRLWSSSLCRPCNNTIIPLSLGSFVAIRLDFHPAPAGPVLPLHIWEHFRRQDTAAVLERGGEHLQKRSLP